MYLVLSVCNLQCIGNDYIYVVNQLSVKDFSLSFVDVAVVGGEDASSVTCP